LDELKVKKMILTVDNTEEGAINYRLFFKGLAFFGSLFRTCQIKKRPKGRFFIDGLHTYDTTLD